MSMTFKEWDEAIDRLEPEVAQKYFDAIETLKDWPEFKKHFGWTGFSALRYPLETVAAGRKNIR